MALVESLANSRSIFISILDAWGWCTGTTQRDGMGREEGGGLRMGPGSGRSSGGGNGNPLQYSCLATPRDRGAWQATVHGVTKSWTRLSDTHTHTHTHSALYFLPSYSRQLIIMECSDLGTRQCCLLNPIRRFELQRLTS